MRLARLALAFVALTVLAPEVSFAQSTGGRIGGFGGSSRSSGSSSGFGGFRSSGSSSSSSSRTSTPPRHVPTAEENAAAAARTRAWNETHAQHGSPEVTPEEVLAFRREPHWTMRAIEDGAAVAAATFFGALVFYLILWLIFAKRNEVRRLSLGFGPRSRVELQERLRTLARNAKTATPSQRGQLLAEVLSLVRAYREDVRYVAWQTFRTRHAEGTKRFFAMANDLRARYRHETTRRAAPDLTYRAEEGPGLLVISLVTFGGRGAHAFGKTPHELDLALYAMEARAPEGLEVIWSPSEQADRLSSAELETLYPELQRLDDQIGRVSCRACHAVYAAELGRCPACGKPR
ncbi:MAG: DUF1517 domain-containing protein [Sandaracinus sp.]|nr:DUF1517 domain-containing protein [Sandaracinus sp.]